MAGYSILSLLSEVDHLLHTGKSVRQHRMELLTSFSYTLRGNFLSVKGLPTC